MTDMAAHHHGVKDSGFHVVLDADSVYLHDDEGEIVMWTQDEWTDDPQLVPVIVNAINIGHAQGPQAVRATLSSAVPIP